MTIYSMNPATEERLASFEELQPAEVDRALSDTDTAFRRWRLTSSSERSALMSGAAIYLRSNRERFAMLMTAEMGKPIVEAEAEIDKCAWNCDYFSEHAEQFLSTLPVEGGTRESYVAFEPLGTVLAIMPWNFPFWQVFRFAAPAIMAGNTALIKHAPNVPQCALAIEEVFREAGFPPGVYRNAFIPIPLVEKAIQDPRVRAVTVTGSVRTGATVASQAGSAVKKTVLELGGSDPFIVLEDADVEQAAATAARARNQNSGQSCIAAKRFIVVDAVAESFEHHFASAVARLQVGDPVQRETNIGPLARADLRDNLERQVELSVRQGARVMLGGHRPERRGYYHLPTLLTEVTPDMPVFQEETFGPAAAVIRVRDTNEAVRVANDTVYGLGASVWTGDLDRAGRIARDIEAGSVFVNALVASDPRLPFGGTKRSGYGRELSEFGIREFVNVKTVVLSSADGTAVRLEKSDAG